MLVIRRSGPILVNQNLNNHRREHIIDLGVDD